MWLIHYMASVIDSLMSQSKMLMGPYGVYFNGNKSREISEW